MDMDAAKSISDLSENAADGVVLNQPQYVVGIGASAGGLEALARIIHKLFATAGSHSVKGDLERRSSRVDVMER